MWGINPQIGENCKLAADCVIEGDVVIGDMCEIEAKVHISGTAGKIIIGNRVKIAQETEISTILNKPCRIEDDVVISNNVIIELSVIGQRTVVGAEAEVKYVIVEPDSAVPQKAILNTGTWGGDPVNFINLFCPLTTLETGDLHSKIQRNNRDWIRKKTDKE